MKKKCLISGLIVIMISLIIYIISLSISPKSAVGGYGTLEDGTTTINRFVTFAHRGYDYVSTLEFDEDATLYDDQEGTTQYWKRCDQVMCIHNTDYGSKKEASKLLAIIDINKDGKNLDGATVTTASGTKPLKDELINKQLAAFSYYVEVTGYGGRDGHCHDESNWAYSKDPFLSQFWETGGYREKLKVEAGVNLPKSTTDGGLVNGKTDAWDFAEAYGETSNPAIGYAARIFIFRSGGQQARAVLFGTPVPTKETKIDKYITTITYPDGTTEEFERAGLSDADKEATAVEVTAGTEITYKITLDDDTTEAKVITDSFETQALEFVGADGIELEYVGEEIGDNNQTVKVYKTTTALDPGESFEITLKAKMITSTTKYYNEAEVEEVEAKDYIKIVGDPPKVNKHIISIEKPDGTTKEFDRSGKTENKKKNDPVKVPLGTKVTYQIDLTGEYAGECNLTDVFDTNIFEFVSSDTFTGSNGTYTAKLTPGKSATITLKVKDKLDEGKHPNTVTLVETGKKSEDYIEIVHKDITIDKYITKIILPPAEEGGEEQVITYNNRKGLSDKKKKESAINVVTGAEITYTIEVGGESFVEVTVEDTFDDDALEYVSSTLGEDLEGKVNPGDTITVTLRVKESVTSSKIITYENEAEVVEENKKSSDFIKVEYTSREEEHGEVAEGNYKKYITHVNGEEVEDRSGYTNDVAKANPVVVEKGDEVTFKLVVENTSDYEISNLEITDTMEDGLSYNGDTEYVHDFGTVAENETVTKSITVDVDMSNMYLLPIENELEVTGGTYEKRCKKIYYKDVTITKSDGTTETKSVIDYIERWTETTKIKDSWFDSNANCDYVEMDDVEIAGDVWIDKDKDGVMDDSESKLKGVTVKLYKGDGTFVEEKTTNNKGHYTFGKVQKGTDLYNGGTRKYTDTSDYVDYYVEFEYSGITYEATVFTNEDDVGDDGVTNSWNKKSHAKEADREGFNEKFETIAYNKAYASDKAENGVDLTYTKSGHTSTLVHNAVTKTSARSIDLFVRYGEEDDIYTECADDEGYLNHINLGLIVRDEADFSLKKDVVSAKVDIKGYSNTYTYESLGANGYTGTYKLSPSYELNLYEADYKFRYDTYSNTELMTEDDELKIELVYKITVTNESPDAMYGVLREVIDISSNTLSIKSAKTESGDSLTIKTTSTYNTTDKYKYSGYQTHYLTGFDDVLAKNESMDIYVTYSVNKDSSRAIELGKKANIAEIGAISIYTDSSGNTPAGTVDKDSNPGVVRNDVVTTITDESLYEDNTYYTSIDIKTRTTPPSPDPEYDQQREITGNVWEDLNTESLGSGQKTGDGKKASGEKGAKNVSVVLLEVIKKDGKEYYVDTGITAETNASGDYTLKGMSVGEYVVRFIYGDEKDEFVTTTGDTIRFSGQDYKSTVYTPVGNASNEDEVVEVTAFKEAKTANGNKQVSIARDNELRRLEVIDYSTTMTYRLDDILKAHASNDTGKTELAKNTSMFADTKKFNIQVENPGNTEVTLSGKEETASGLVIYTYLVDEVNFGLIERPVTKLELLDDIKEITATTASGNEILHIYFKISYKLENGRVKSVITLDKEKSIGDENVQLLDRSNTTKGFRYVNIDSELLQGMKITVKYQFAIANIGDIDTSNQNLIDMVKNYDVGKVAKTLRTEIGTTQYKYGTGSGKGAEVLRNYSFSNTKSAVDKFKTGTYGKYKTVVSGSANNKNYELGYFLGSSYYNTYSSTTDKTVETRVDQIVSYVDNDLVFKPSENLNNGAEKYLNYTIPEIAEKGLLRGITVGITNSAAQAKLNDGTVSYITEGKNNLAFNVESATVNGGLYKFLTPLKGVTNVDKEKLYVIDLEASRILASELDAENVSFDNLTEIVKITNTVGRKTYIEFLDAKTGSIVQPGPSGPTGYLGNTPDIIKDPDEYTVGVKEIDTNFTETVTFSPPTGLTIAEQKVEKTGSIIKVITAVVGVILVGSGSFYLIRRKRFYK